MAIINIGGEQFESLEPGDILFFSAKRSFASVVNILWQHFRSKAQTKALLKELKFYPTHVGIAYDEFIFIDSNKRNGVKYSSLGDYIEMGNYLQDILIYRNLALEKQKLKNSLIHEIIDEQYWGMKYSKLGAVFMKEFNGRKFCSELAIDFLCGAQAISKINSASVYPNQLLEMCENVNEWRKIDRPYFRMLLDKNFYQKYSIEHSIDDDEKFARLDEIKTSLQISIGAAKVMNGAANINSRLSVLISSRTAASVKIQEEIAKRLQSK